MFVPCHTRVVSGYSNRAKVCAKYLVEQARAATKKDSCAVLRRIAEARLDDADAPVFRALVDAGLALNCPIDRVQCTESYSYPCLPPKQLLESVATRGFLHNILGVPAEKAAEVFKDFWCNFKHLHPSHEIFYPEVSQNISFEHLIPFYCHGDGGRGFKKGSIMILSMYPCMGRGTAMCPASQHAPSASLSLSQGRGRKRAREEPTAFTTTGVNLLGHSLSTRFLFTAMSSEQYKHNNAVFVGLVDKWGEQLSSLFDHGFQHEGTTWRVAVLGLTGDAPFLREAGLHNRSFSNMKKVQQSQKELPGICWLCAAGKDDGAPFEEVGLVHARWIQTTGAANHLPWDTPGPLLKHLAVDHTDLASFYRPDLFHILHAGVYKDFSASSLIYFLKSLLKQRSIDASLNLLNAELGVFLQTHKTERIHFRKLTLDLLGYTSSKDYPSGHWSKNMDSATMMKFCLFILNKPENADMVHTDPLLQEIQKACEHSNTFMRRLFTCGMWLTFEEADDAICSGHGFLIAYSKLAKETYKLGRCLYALKPKLHMLNHIVYSLWAQRRGSSQDRSAIRNPIAESTFMCEDFVGQIARLSRKVSPKLVGEKTIFRYLVASLTALNEAC